SCDARFLILRSSGIRAARLWLLVPLGAVMNSDPVVSSELMPKAARLRNLRPWKPVNPATQGRAPGAPAPRRGGDGGFGGVFQIPFSLAGDGGDGMTGKSGNSLCARGYRRLLEFAVIPSPPSPTDRAGWSDRGRSRPRHCQPSCAAGRSSARGAPAPTLCH